MTTKKTHAISQDNQKAQGKQQNTRYFREPLFTIINATNGERLVVIGATTKQQAIERCQQLRREIHLPRAEQLDAVFLETGPITSGTTGGTTGGIPFYSSKYFDMLRDFDWQSEMADDLAARNIVCPMCGR